jgi:ATP-dependent helicase HrpB
MLNLPIDTHLDSISQAIKTYGSLIIKATPGSGKTTRVPWHLARQTAGKVLVLEPRRLAARLAAQWVCEENQQQLGERVGYQFRHESQQSEKTQLLFLTEGTFLRRLTNNPTLEGHDIVVIDEFHERHLDTDISLGLLRALQLGSRPDLKIVLMSATLESSPLETFLEKGGVKVFDVKGAVHPLEIRYLPNTPSLLDRPLIVKIREALANCLEGHVLIFFSGMRDILAVAEGLQHTDDLICPLHGDLTKEEQALALLPSKRRKIILATNIAESALTIPGVCHVIDTGTYRRAEYSPFSGLMSLKEKKISRSSADQRAGRAARTSPGLCQRLYSKLDYETRPYADPPEIVRADLSEIALLIAALPFSPVWFETPPESQWLAAWQQLFKLGAIDHEKKLTAIGAQMSEFPLPPRYARALTESMKLAPQERRDFAGDLAQRLEPKNSKRLFERLWNQIKHGTGLGTLPMAQIYLTGFIDHLARKSEKHFVLASGETLRPARELHDILHDPHPLWIVLDTNLAGEITELLPVEEEWPYDLIPFPFEEERDCFFDEKKKQVLFREKIKIGSLVFEERDIPSEPTLLPKAAQLLFKSALPILDQWLESSFFSRAFWLSQFQKKSLPSEREWWQKKLPEILLGQFSVDQNAISMSLNQVVLNQLELAHEYELNEWMPENATLSDGRLIAICYELSGPPYLESYIQDFYGLAKTPSIAKGQHALVLKLRGPHKRPLQVTQDLDNFWRVGYLQMKKELMRDYPRHHWPDRPETALPVLLKSRLPKV